MIYRCEFYSTDDNGMGNPQFVCRHVIQPDGYMFSNSAVGSYCYELMVLYGIFGFCHVFRCGQALDNMDFKVFHTA